MKRNLETSWNFFRVIVYIFAIKIHLLAKYQSLSGHTKEQLTKGGSILLDQKKQI